MKSSTGCWKWPTAVANVPAFPAWRRIAPFVPSGLLCLVAVLQLYQSRAEGLTPWNGGGFGMFSTNDDGLARSLRIRISGSQGQRDLSVPPSPLPPSLSNEATLAVAVPSGDHLRALALGIAHVQEAEGFPASRVQVAVRRLDYDPQTLTPRLEVIRELSLRVQQPPQSR